MNKQWSRLSILACVVGVLSVANGLNGALIGIVAIILGIGAIRSNLKSKQSGSQLAWVGIACGLFTFGNIYLHRDHLNQDAARRAPLRRAEMAIMSKEGDRVGYGNSSNATSMAEKCSKKLKLSDDEWFVKDEEAIARLSSTEGDFLVWCNASENGIAFLIHIPVLAAYNYEEKQILNALCWKAAVATLQEIEESTGVKLAVAIRSSISLDSVLIGIYEGMDTKFPQGPVYNDPIHGNTSNEDRLLPFFTQ